MTTKFKAPDSAFLASRVSSEFFSWDKSRMEFTADASTLDHNRQNTRTTIDEDGEERGFVMVSEKTGNEILWVQHDTETDQEGDVMGWLFRLSVHSQRQMPHLKGAVVYVIND